MRAKAAAKAAAQAVLAAQGGDQAAAALAGAAAAAVEELAAADDRVREDEDDADDDAVAEAFADAAAEQHEDDEGEDEEEEAAAAAESAADGMELSAAGAGAGAAQPAAAAAAMPAHQSIEDQRAAVKAARRELSAYRAGIRRQLPVYLRLIRNALSIRDSFHKARATSNPEGSAFRRETDAENEEDAADADAAAAAAAPPAAAGGAAAGAAHGAVNARVAAEKVQCPLIVAMKSGTKKQCQTTYQKSSVASFKKHLATHVTRVMASANWAKEHPQLVDVLYAQLKNNRFAAFELTEEEAQDVALESDAMRAGRD